MSRTTQVARLALFAVTVAFVLSAGVRPATALPAFARKYQTSCTTCHTIFPKLNPFGEAFRLNGYRMPKETEDQIKQPQMSLGSEAYKKIWPKAVAPSDIPGFAPLAFNTKLGILYLPTENPDTGKTEHIVDFQFPQEVNLFGAGTFGEHFSFLAELTFGQAPDGGVETEIEHAQLHINSPFGPEHVNNFKVGKFSPDFEDGFQEMWLMTDNGVDTLFNYSPIGINGGTGLGEDGPGIALPALVQGIEYYGVAKHRLFYTVGLTNGLPPTNGSGTTDGNTRKDYYARVDWKFGGMGLDGDTGGRTMPAENWREKSLRVGVLGYWGNGEGINLGDPVLDPIAGIDVVQQDKDFERGGAYVSLCYQDLNVFGVYQHGRDTLQNIDAADSITFVSEATFSYDAWFAQADYVIRPPFQVSLRYENLNPGDDTAEALKFWNANFSFLSRANVKMMAEYRWDTQNAQDYTMAGVLRFAY